MGVDLSTHRDPLSILNMVKVIFSHEHHNYAV